MIGVYDLPLAIDDGVGAGGTGWKNRKR